MKTLKQYIKEEIIKLSEVEYTAPPDILYALKNKLKMDPLVRYIDKLKAVNSIPPSYRIFLHNGQTFDIIYEGFSLLAKIGSKKYYLNNISEKNYAIQHINRLLTGSTINPEEEEEGEEEETPSPGGAPTPPPPPAEDEEEA